MTAVIIHVQVKPEFIDAFIKATGHNHENSIKEPGVFRFDVIQDSHDHGKFILYEVYKSEEAVAAHKETAHYALWRDTVVSWMASPRQGVKHKLLFPASN
jgi:(4S)-4-hydroxy-5-phosphonooxypentane-2,3-dione isomerase